MTIECFVIDGKLEAAAHRVPPYVIGDGKSTIAELVDSINKDPRRGFGHEKVLTRIKIDEMTERLLNNKGLKQQMYLEMAKNYI